MAISAMGSDSGEASDVAQQDPYQGGTDSESPGGAPGTHEVLRFKSLQPPQSSKKTVIPFLIQVSLRDNSLYETSSWLSRNSDWMLVEARLRQHMVRPTQLVTQLLKGHGPLFLDQGFGHGDGLEAGQPRQCLLAQRHCGGLLLGSTPMPRPFLARSQQWRSNVSIPVQPSQQHTGLAPDNATQAWLTGWHCEGQQELLSFTSHFFWDGVNHVMWITPGNVELMRLRSSNAMTKGESLVPSF